MTISAEVHETATMQPPGVQLDPADQDLKITRVEVLDNIILVMEDLPMGLASLISTVISVTSRVTLETTSTKFMATLRGKEVDLPLMLIMLLQEEILSQMLEPILLRVLPLDLMPPLLLQL